MQDGADITCRKCGCRNSLGSRFCGNCGLRIDGFCDSCGHKNEPQARFCNICGTGLNGEERQAPPELGSGAPRAFGPILCPRCSHQNEPESQFCYHCGLPLEEYPASVAPSGRAFQYGAPGGFWVRVVAVIIDSIVWGVFALLIFIPFYILFFGDSDTSDASTLTYRLLIYFLAFLYSPVLIGLWSTTIGKRALNLYVVRVDGSRCSFWRALGRAFAQILSAMPFGIGYLMVAFREDKRSLHDLIAGTAVIRR